MRLWHILRSRTRSLLFRNGRERDLNEELQFHLDRETERLQHDGVGASAARLQAMRTFGGVDPTKEACRDARGIGMIDSFFRDVRYACRSFARAPLAAATIIGTVGLGLGLVTVVFTILNAYVFRVDGVRNPAELFGVERQQIAGGESSGFTREQYDSLVRETTAFSETFATTGDVAGWIDGSRREGRLVTGNFFQMLGVSAGQGRVIVPSDDQPGALPIMVLSHRSWTQHFASDPSIVDRTVLLNGVRVQIVGIAPESFRGLEPVAAPDFWAPLSLRSEFDRNARDTREANLQVVGRLNGGTARGQALAQLLAWDSRQPAPAGERPPSLILVPRSGTVPLSLETMLAFIPLFFAFGLILVIGCANVGNLLLARAVARQREIGIRLAVGASRRRIVWQLLTENLVLSLIAAAFAYGVSRLTLSLIAYFLLSSFPPGMGNLRIAVPPADWRVAAFLIGGAIASTVLFALAPALQATRLELVRAIRGEVVRDARPNRARNTLIALQVTGSMVLLVCAAIFLRGSLMASTEDPGIRTEGIVSLRVLNERMRGTMLDAVAREPLVDGVAAAWPGEMAGLVGLPAFAQPGGSGSRTATTYQFVSPEYFTLFGLQMVRGRGFTPAERSINDAVAVVSEPLARQLWPSGDPVGQVLRIEPNPPAEMAKRETPLLAARTAVVIGVTRDIPGIRFVGMRLGESGVYLPIAGEVEGTTLAMNVRGSAERVRQVLVDRLAAIDPNGGEVESLQTIAQAETYLLGIPFWITVVLGSLALLLTVSGLFSVLSYLVAHRTKEIGVRMALGATPGKIAAVVLRQSARPVVAGLLVGGSLTSAVGAVLLASPAAGTVASTVRLFDPVAYLGCLACIAIACGCAAVVPVLRAGRVSPVVALRHE